MKLAHNYFSIGKKCHWLVIKAFWSKWAFFAINNRGWCLLFSSYPSETVKQAKARISCNGSRDTLNDSD